MLAFFISWSLFCILMWRQKRLSVIIPVGMMIFISVFAVVLGDRILNRLLEFETISARITFIKLSLRMIADSPLFGIGANKFGSEINRFVTSEINGRFFYVVHNQYLLVMTETGIGGLIAFLWFLLSSLRRG